MTIPLFDAFGDAEPDDGHLDPIQELEPLLTHDVLSAEEVGSDVSGDEDEGGVHGITWLPFEWAPDDGDGDATHATQRAIMTEDGGSLTGCLLKHPELDKDGTLSVVSTKHGIDHVGDVVWVRLGESDEPFESGMIPATVTHISEGSDRFRAEIATEYADFIHDMDVDIIEGEDVEIGEDVHVEQLAGAGVQETVMRLGYVSGEAGFGNGTHTLRQTDAGPGSSGSMVVSEGTGHVVGMVMAYDEVQHVNIIDDIDRVMQDLDDFATEDPSLLEDTASDVDYGGATPVKCHAQEMDEARASGCFAARGGPRCEGH